MQPWASTCSTHGRRRTCHALREANSATRFPTLTTIKAIAREIGDDGDSRGKIVEIEADRLNQYVSNLLDLSRLNAGALRVTPDVVPIEDLLGATLQQLTGIVGNREVRVELATDGPMLAGCLDFGLTLRALGNLIENALRYSATTAVEIRAYRNDRWVDIDVADRGPGILAADEERIFRPFQRGSATPEAQGAGLGLSIARRALEAQGGTVKFKPRAGGGSVFTMSIPIANAGEPERGSL
jgi:two-component system sensor histidine kinase KdpD